MGLDTTLLLKKIIKDETPYEANDSRFYVEPNGDKTIVDLVFAPCTLEHLVKVLDPKSKQETLVSQKCKDMVPKKYLLHVCTDCGQNLMHKTTRQRVENEETYLKFEFGCGCNKVTHYKEYRIVPDAEISSISKAGKEQLLASFL